MPATEIAYELAEAICRKKRLTAYKRRVVMSYLYYILNDICSTIEGAMRRNGHQQSEYEERKKMFDIALEAIELSKTQPLD